MKMADPGPSPRKYVAFLRGVNVGGHTMKMADLRKAFEASGFRNVRTILASGNVIFEAAGPERNVLARKIEEALEKRWGFAIPVVLRAADQLRALIASDPFKGVIVTPATRLYITFPGEKASTTAKLPYASPEGDVKVFRVPSGEVASVLTLSPSRREHTVPPSLASAGPSRRGHTVPSSASMAGPSRRGHTVPPSLASAGPSRRGHTVPPSLASAGPSRRGHMVPPSLAPAGPGRGTTDLMAGLEKVFGKDVTTRNWNTLKKLPL